MLTNMVSPPTAGTSFAHRMVAIGGLAGNGSSECPNAMPNGGAEGGSLFMVWELDELGRVCLVRRERMNRQLTKSSAKLDQIFGRDILVAEDDQLVLDQRVVERLELLVRQRPAKINAADLRAQMDADFRHGDAGRLRADRLALVEFEWLVHGAILPETRALTHLLLKMRGPARRR